MWESQVLLTDGQVVFSGYSGFRPPLMNDRLDISEIFLKGPLNPNPVSGERMCTILVNRLED